MTESNITALMPLCTYVDSFLKKSILSVHEQSSPDWRLLFIVEGADVHKFKQILQPALSDSRVDLIVNQGRKLAGAINTGMRAATTKFNALLFSDDMWAPETVEVLDRYIAEMPEIDFFHSSRIIIDEEGREVSSVYKSKESFTLDEFIWKPPVKHLLCWRREMGLAIGGVDESLNSVGPDDWDFPWVMAENGAKFRAVPECLYIHRDHRECGRLTTHLPLSVHKKEIRRILKKHGVDNATIKNRVEKAEASFLRQCLYKNRLDKWLKQLKKYNPRLGWRESYKQ